MGTTQTPKPVNQTQNGGQWVSPGAYPLAAGNAAKVTLTDAANGPVNADAVKLVRTVTETDNEAKTFPHAYDANANLLTLTDSSPGAKVDAYAMTYNGLNQLTKVEEKLASVVKNTTQFTYDENGAPLTRDHDRQDSLFRYDPRDMLDKVTNTETGGTSKITTFTYTPRGRVSKETKPNGNTVDHTYNLDGSLASQIEKKSGGILVAQHLLDYTANGNRACDAAKIQNADNATAYLDHVYDPLDRTSAKTDKAGTPSAKTTDFAYLGLTDKVVTEEIAGQLQRTYQYDAFDRRLTQVKKDTDGAGPEVAEDSTYGYNPHTDVKTPTKDNGDTRATYGYTAYGSDDGQDFTGIDKPDTQQPDKEPFNFYRYNGKRYDPASSSYDMGFRDYNPSINRFNTRDTYNGALDDINLGTDPFNGNCYAFTGGNPITEIEQDGQAFCADENCTESCSECTETELTAIATSLKVMEEASVRALAVAAPSDQRSVSTTPRSKVGFNPASMLLLLAEMLTADSSSNPDRRQVDVKEQARQCSAAPGHVIAEIIYHNRDHWDRATGAEARLKIGSRTSMRKAGSLLPVSRKGWTEVISARGCSEETTRSRRTSSRCTSQPIRSR
ncbi:hypothetical protein L6E12_11215 [Actinokineospora sp. PR83]|uniref:RHS repeat domain-containing protein n=1 Tax=Actinokineospora sp. PR83 TaxID=2884908 RepID=UPI001F18E83A|nr:RHS repeat-associated core domain-containing protein [Actinokineospora sp. PR83]MCG8916359.1 hypothetical protein [Actinokineospora sp. PR83]